VDGPTLLLQCTVVNRESPFCSGAEAFHLGSPLFNKLNPFLGLGRKGRGGKESNKMDELEAVFNQFSTFGNRLDGPVMMETRNCQKLAKDCGLTGKKLTSTDIDIIFAKVKTKGKKKISFEEFLTATQFFAEKLEISHAELVLRVVNSAGPRVNSNVPNVPSLLSEAVSSEEMLLEEFPPRPPSVEAPKVMPRLHPDWFEAKNPNATGTNDQFYYFNPYTKETTWVAPLIVASDIEVPPPPPLVVPSIVVESLKCKTKKTYPSTAVPNKLESSRSASSLETVESKQKDVFDKLTDPRLYTGAHKSRFDLKTGRGKGLEGGDRAAKGVGTPHTPRSKFKGNTNTNTDEQITSIAQILRTK